MIQQFPQLLVYTHHPDHQVGEDGDPDGGEDEGKHEELLPTRFGAVWDGEEEEEEQWPGYQPFSLAANAGCNGHTVQGLFESF